MACRADKDFLYDFYHDLIESKKIRRIISSEYVKDVMVKERKNGDERTVFYMNFSNEKREIEGLELEGYEVACVVL